MIVMRTPKGWTCPKEIDGKREEGYWRAHQVPMSDMDEARSTSAFSRTGWKATGRASCSTRAAASRPEIAALAPTGTRRMSANPHANGGVLLRDLRLPDFRDYAVETPSPGVAIAETTRVMGTYLRDVMKLNLESAQFPPVQP